jgi:carbamoyl-phosphate synthase large subunit
VDGLAPALWETGKRVHLPKVSAPGYRESVLAAVEKHRIDLVVPTIDTELIPLSDLAPSLRSLGCVPLTSARSFLEICGDKFSTLSRFGEYGVTGPRSWLPTDSTLEVEIPAELIVKPRNGSASRDVFRVSRESLWEVLPLVSNPIIQEMLIGDEITIDALFSRSGTLLHYVPRRRIRTLAGESIQGATLDDAGFFPWLSDVSRAISSLGGIGPMTIQGFVTDSGPVLTEVNPRFGGGFPLAHAAGALYPEWIVEEYEGRPVEPVLGRYVRGLYMTRFHIERIVKSPLW